MTPLHLTLLIINAACFGGCIVLLIVGNVSGPLILLTIGTGLSMLGKFVEGILKCKNESHESQSAQKKRIILHD